MDKVKSSFEESHFRFEEDAPLQKCVFLLHEYFKSATELTEAYEIFTMQKGVKGKIVTEGTLSRFETFHRKILGTSTNQTPSPPETKMTEFATPVKYHPTRMETGKKTNFEEYRSPPSSPFLSSGRSFSERKQKGQTVVCFNEHLPTDQNARNKVDVLHIEILRDPFTTSRRVLNDTLSLKTAYTHNRISNFIVSAEQCYQLDLSSPFNQPSQDPVWLCGMICCDSDGRLNPLSMKLLGPQNVSSSIVLDISQLTDFCFFPGQIVAIKGLNPTGHCFIVLDVICHLPPIIAQRPSKVLAQSMLVASGPYSTTEDLGYAALTEILHLCEMQTFDYVILGGPFVSIQHPLLSQGDLDLTFEDVYSQMVVPILTKIESYCGSLIIVPSINDAHVLPVFPQPPFIARRSLRNCQYFPNPCTFKIGEVIIGICTHDVIKTISMSVCEKLSTKQDRIGLLLQHLLGQRSFYPLFPPRRGSCMDASLSSFLEIPSALDILICPSDLQTYAKLIHPSIRGKEADSKQCLCINPGRLVRGNNGGTYALINIGPEDTSSHNIHENISVDIIRI